MLWKLDRYLLRFFLCSHTAPAKIYSTIVTNVHGLGQHGVNFLMFGVWLMPALQQVLLSSSGRILKPDSTL